MDAGSGKSAVSRFIDWIRGRSDTSSSAPSTNSGPASRPDTSTPPGTSPSRQDAAPRESTGGGTPAAPAETTPTHLPSEQANVPPNAASLDLDSARDAGATPAPSSPEASASSPAPDLQTADAASTAPPPTAADLDATSAISAQPAAPPDPIPAGESTTTDSALADLGNVQDNARRANYGRGNVEAGARASAGSPTSEPPEADPEPGDGLTSNAHIQGDATAQAATDLDASELGALEDAEPAASETGLDSSPGQPAGLIARSGESEPESDPDTVLPDDGATTGAYSRSDAFDSVDSTGIFGLADRDSASIGYLDDASRESFDATVDEPAESTGLFGLRDVSSTDLDYLSSSESDRFDFDLVSTNDIATGEDFDSTAGGSPSAVAGDPPPGSTAVAGETAPDSSTGVGETLSSEPELSTSPDGMPSGDIHQAFPGDDVATNGSTSTADPETLLAGDAVTQSGSTSVDPDPSSAIVTESTELSPNDTLDRSAERAGSQSGEATHPTTPVTNTGSARAAAGAGTGSSPGTGDRVRGADGVCPPGYPIKGNASSKIYHVPGLVSYEKTKAEWCFPSENDAVSFGYRAPGGHRNQAIAHSGPASTPPTGRQHISQDNPSHAVEPSVAGSTANGQPATPVTTAQHADTTVGPARKQQDSPGPKGAVAGNGSRTCPAGYPIKGNGGSMIFHVPGTASYDATIPEWCFATEDDAVSAGFRAPRRRM